MGTGALVRGEDRGRRVPRERRRPRDHLVAEHAHRVDVRARRGRGTGGLLGSEVLRGTHDLAGDGQVLGGVREDLGDAEIGELHPSVGHDQHVRGLHVAMDDAAVVGRGERGQHLAGHVGRLGERQRPATAQDLSQRRTLDQLHHQVRTVGILSRIEERDRVGMREAGQRMHLAGEARPGRGVGEVAPEPLQRDETTQPLCPVPDRSEPRLGGPCESGDSGASLNRSPQPPPARRTRRRAGAAGPSAPARCRRPSQDPAAHRQR